MSVVMTSFSNRFLHYDVINNVFYERNTTFVLQLAKLACYFLIFHIPPTSDPMLLQTFRVFSDDSSNIKSFGIEGWGNRNIDDDKCAKMPFFSCIRKLNKCICLLFNHINYKPWLFGIYSQFGLSSNYLCNKNWTIPCFIILISNRTNFAVRGPSFFIECLH